MCRYNRLGPRQYRTHWACAPCRRSFKAEDHIPQTCPTCQEPMVNMGRDFHPPRRANLTQWRKIELLVQANLLFHSCGCSGPGARPRSLADATSQLRRRRSDRKAFAPAGRWRGPVALGVTVR